MTEVVDLVTARGTARLHVHPPPTAPAAIALLLHGAGTGTDREPLPTLAEALAAAGLLAVRLDQPYVVAGRRAPAPAAHLDEVLLAVLPTVRLLAPGVSLGVVGRSSGARVACRTAAAAGTAAIAALGFPYRPPGTDKDRADELRAGAAVCPVLVVQGDRDPFGRPPRLRGVQTRLVAGMAHTPSLPAALLAGRWLARTCPM